VRPATEADAARLGEIELATWDLAATPDPKPPAGGPFFVSVRPSDVLVATINDEPVGFVRLHFDLEAAHRHVVEMWGLCVAPESMRQGLGSFLVHAALKEARRRGCTRMTLGVMGHNTAARALYERCGFVVEGVLKGEYRDRDDGRSLDFVLMAYELS
jgi:ribosomal protein S18 acetylase RimI-like enzyme